MVPRPSSRAVGSRRWDRQRKRCGESGGCSRACWVMAGYSVGPSRRGGEVGQERRARHAEVSRHARQGAEFGERPALSDRPLCHPEHKLALRRGLQEGKALLRGGYIRIGRVSDGDIGGCSARGRWRRASRGCFLCIRRARATAPARPPTRRLLPRATRAPGFAPRLLRWYHRAVVPVVGVEPHMSVRTHDFESRASAYSATPAW